MLLYVDYFFQILSNRPPVREQFGILQSFISKILSRPYFEIERVADYLQRHPYVKVRIEGHTDNQGDLSLVSNRTEKGRRKNRRVKIEIIETGISAKEEAAKVGIR